MTDQDFFRVTNKRVLADDWGVLTKYEYQLKRRSGEWQDQIRETYDRGNGATCLLHDPKHDCVLLTRQFRLPVFVNDGPKALVESPAGLLEGADPASRMREELIEETGFNVSDLEHLFNVYMSPGSVTEYLAFFIGEYSKDDPVGTGGGKYEEGEDIEVLHVPFSEALDAIGQGEHRDAKTIILLQHLALRRLAKDRSA